MLKRILFSLFAAIAVIIIFNIVTTIIFSPYELEPFYMNGKFWGVLTFIVLFAREQKKDSETATPEEEKPRDQDKQPDGYGLGRYVAEYEPHTYYYLHAAHVKDITAILPSNHPLTIPEARYLEEKKADYEEWITVFKEKIRLDQYGGHLAIGGHLFTDQQGHMITVGGARSGKGACLIVPALASLTNLFDGAPSYICLDPKGENIAITGNFLRSAGYKVICINPFAIPEIEKFGDWGFNVFDTFSYEDADFDKYADMVSNAIVAPTRNSNEHFQKTSRAYIGLYIRYMMVQDEEPKNFKTLYRWLRLGGDQRMDFLEKMALSNAFDGDITSEASAIHNQISSGANKEVESTYSTIRAATDVFKSQPLRDSISRSDFDVTQIAHEKTAIFVCMNPSDLEDNQAWLRILFGSFIRSLTRHYSKTRKVVMIMDEFPTMGHFKEFEIMSGFMAGYNVTLWPIMQDLTQLKALYPDRWETFINNSFIRHFMSVGDNFTADYVSKRMPIVEVGHKDNGNLRRQPFLSPDKVMANSDIIVFISGLGKPAFFLKKSYWQIPYVKNWTKDNPFR